MPTSESRSIYLNPRLKLILAELKLIWHKYPLKGRKKGQHLNRNSVDRVVKGTFAELHTKGASPHSTRRTCLTILKDKGWQDADIMSVIGHKDFNSLKKYLHTTPKQMKNMACDFDKVFIPIFWFRFCSDSHCPFFQIFWFRIFRSKSNHFQGGQLLFESDSINFSF